MLPIIFPTFIKMFAKILWDVCHLISKSCVNIYRFTWLFPRNSLYLSMYLLIGSLIQTTLPVHCSTSYSVCLLGPLRCLIDMHALSTLYTCKKNYLVNPPSPGFPQQSSCWTLVRLLTCVDDKSDQLLPWIILAPMFTSWFP